MAGSEDIAKTLELLRQETGYLDRKFRELAETFTAFDSTPTAKNLQTLGKEVEKFGRYASRVTGDAKKAELAQKSFFIAQDALNRRYYQQRLRDIERDVAAARGAGTIQGVLANRVAQAQVKAAELIYNTTGVQMPAALGRAAKWAIIVGLALEQLDSSFGGIARQSQLIIPSLIRMGVGFQGIRTQGVQAIRTIDEAKNRLGFFGSAMMPTKKLVELTTVATREHAQSLVYLGAQYSAATKYGDAAVQEQIYQVSRISGQLALIGNVFGMETNKAVEAFVRLGTTFKVRISELPQVMVGLGYVSSELQVPMESLVDVMQTTADSVYLAGRDINAGFKDITGWASAFRKVGIQSSRDMETLLKGVTTTFSRVSPLWYMAVQNSARPFGEQLVDAVTKTPLEKAQAIGSRLLKEIERPGKSAKAITGELMAMLSSAGMGDLDAQSKVVAEALQVIAKSGASSSRDLQSLLQQKGFSNETIEELTNIGATIEAAEEPFKAMLNALREIQRDVRRLVTLGGMLGPAIPDRASSEGAMPIIFQGGLTASQLRIKQSGMVRSTVLK